MCRPFLFERSGRDGNSIEYEMKMAPREVRIGEVIRDAVVFSFRNSKETAVKAEALIEAVARLFTLLEEKKIDYVLVGGIAMLQYVEGRNTKDLDLILDAESLQMIPEVTITGQDRDFVRARFGDLQVDILRSQHPLFAKVRKDYSDFRDFFERRIRCATVEGLLLLKLFSLPSLYRQGNLDRVALYEGDIMMLLPQCGIPAEALCEQITPYVLATDLEEIRKIVSEVQQRIGRFRERSENRP